MMKDERSATKIERRYYSRDRISEAVAVGEGQILVFLHTSRSMTTHMCNDTT